MDMAKNDKDLDKALNKAIDDILKDYKGAMREAVKFAAKKTEADMMNKAKNCLQEYYDNFEPNAYKRTHILQYAFLPYSKIQYGDDKISGSVGVQYDAETLEQYIGEPSMYLGSNGMPKVKHVGYYGSSNYQPVDAWWVIDNYLNGIHPTTDGKYTYIEIVDPVSPNRKMDEFIKNYAKTFDTNVFNGLLDQIAKKM
jgi:hypothetical protein